MAGGLIHMSSSDSAAAASGGWLFGSLVAMALASWAARPVAAQVLVGDGTVSCGVRYVIASGDTLSGLAKRAYGDPML